MTSLPKSPQPPFRDLAQAQAFLDSRIDLEKISSGRSGRMSLAPMLGLLDALGHPEKSFRSIHVGGTVGKGSTARFLAAMLEACGFRVGLYTSPHVERLTERVLVGGEEIDPRDFAAAIGQLAPHADACKASYFDLLTAAAFVHFRDAKIDWAVVEVGLGGRIDSTNAILPEIAIITNVGSDHADVLGKTVAERAQEKAGIVKREVPLVTDARDPEALAVIEQSCLAQAAPLFRLPTLTPDVPAHLPAFQRRNFALAQLAFDTLARRQQWKPLSQQEQHRIAHTVLPARCERFPGNPIVILDGAHMPEAVEALLAALDDAASPRVALFGAAMDKDAKAMLKLLARWADRGVMCAASNPRAIATNELLRICREIGWPAHAAASPAQALEMAREQARDGTLLVTGSLYLAGEIRPLLRKES